MNAAAMLLRNAGVDLLLDRRIGGIVNPDGVGSGWPTRTALTAAANSPPVR